MAISSYIGVILLIYTILVHCDGWQAVPANQASFAIRSFLTHAEDKQKELDRATAFLHSSMSQPRAYLHSVYKFGFCPPEVTVRQFLRSTANMSFETYREVNVNYIYLIADFRSTTRFKLQCVVMKIFVPQRFLFYHGRLPVYYCQGQLYIMVFDSVQRLAIHELYFDQRINMPMDITFEFYHPNIF